MLHWTTVFYNRGGEGAIPRSRIRHLLFRKKILNRTCMNSELASHTLQPRRGVLILDKNFMHSFFSMEN